MKRTFTSRCRKIIYPCVVLFILLKHSVLQVFSEGQKCIRGTEWGLHFYKETYKIDKNALFLEFLAYLYFVVW